MPDPLNRDTDLTDEQLMLALAGGDQASFDALFNRYRQRVYGFYRRRVPDPARAEELTQETFLVVLRIAGRFEPRALFRTFLFAIAFRILRADRRKAAFRAFFFPREMRAEPSRQQATEEILWLRQGLARLEKTEREILMLREFEQLSYGDIAEVLRMPRNTVRSRLFRARMALKENLQGNSASQKEALLVEGDRA